MANTAYKKDYDPFEQTVVRHEGFVRKGWRVMCRYCDQEYVMEPNTKKNPAPTLLHKMARNAGWETGKKLTDSTCPNCLKKQAAIKAEKREAKRAEKEENEKLMQQKPNGGLGLEVQQPREPSRQDVRKIVSELEDHFDEVSGKYRGGTTDATIAADLAVPRAWVTKTREEWFGPLKGNEDLDNVRADLAAFKGEFLRLENNILKQVEDMMTSLDNGKKKLTDIEDRLLRTEKAVMGR